MTRGFSVHELVTSVSKERRRSAVFAVAFVAGLALCLALRAFPAGMLIGMLVTVPGLLLLMLRWAIADREVEDQSG